MSALALLPAVYLAVRAAEEELVAVPAAGPVFASLEDMPEMPLDTVVIANELLDNLPFGIAQWDGTRWDEVRVAVDGGRFVEILVPAAEVDAAVEPEERVELLAEGARDARRRREERDSRRGRGDRDGRESGGRDHRRGPGGRWPREGRRARGEGCERACDGHHGLYRQRMWSVLRKVPTPCRSNGALRARVT